MKVNGVLLARVRSQINHFKKTGAVFSEHAEKPQRNKVPDAFKANSLNKCVQILRNQYDGLLFDKDNKVIDTSKINTRDLTSESKRGFNLLIFSNLMKLKSHHKKPIDKNLLLILLGVKLKNLNDKVKVTEQVEKLAKQDKAIERARYLLKLSYYKNTVALNKLLQLTLQNFQDPSNYNLHHTQTHTKRLQIVQDAMGLLNDCKKWGYEPNEQSYAILFGGISKLFQYGEITNQMSKKLINMYEVVPEPTVNVFNALLSCLTRDTSNNQYHAWDIFNKIEGSFKPNVQSFTTFLQGLIKFNEQQVEEVKRSSRPRKEKNLEIYRLNNQLVDLGQVILTKTPTIDSFFMAQYTSCFINQSYSELYGHHYSSAGLQQLSDWVPEIEQFIKIHKLLINPSSGLAFRDNKRLERTIKEHLERTGISDTEGEDDGTDDFTKRQQVSYKTTTKVEVNRILLYKFVQGLAQLDRPVQFVSSVWRILSDFAGIEFQKYPSIKSGEYDVEVKIDHGMDMDMEVVDSKIIENFIFHINGLFNKEMKASILCLTVIKYARMKKGLVNGSTYKHLYSIINEEINHLTRSNSSTAASKRYKGDILSNSQLDYLLQCLNIFAAITPDLEMVAKLAQKIGNCSWYEVKGPIKKEYYINSFHQVTKENETKTKTGDQ